MAVRNRPRPGRLGQDRRGTAVTEFALVLPVMVLLLVGSYQMTDAVFAYRKITKTARTVADLTSQYVTLTDTDLDTILSASQQVLAPYSATPARLTISQVTVNASGSATVSWSRGKTNTGATTGYAVGSTFYVPPTYKQAGTTIIVADIAYDYVPAFASSYFGAFTMKEQVTMYPRKSTTIAKS